MIDQDYIDELRAQEKAKELTPKEAKQKLAEYAKESFNFDVKRTRSFDNIISDIEDHIKQYNIEAGLDEPEEGSFSPTDFVDEINTLVMKGEDIPVVEEIVVPEPVQEVKPDLIKMQEIAGIFIETASSELPSVQEAFELKDTFNPTIILIGRSPGYYNLPWWIFEWIQRTPDWKSDPKSFEHQSAHSTLLSLIYYINRDGQVRIRETKHSKFHVLK